MGGRVRQWGIEMNARAVYSVIWGRPVMRWIAARVLFSSTRSPASVAAPGLGPARTFPWAQS